MRLAIITTHPIQYYAPVFGLLHKRKNIDIKVFYTWGELAIKKFDPGFGENIDWDMPLLDGYPYEWVINTSINPGSHHFRGIINPGLNNQVKTWDPDAILVFGWAYHGHLKALRYFKDKIPVYFRGDSTLLDEQKGIKSILKSLFLKWVYRHVDHAFYTGTNNKAYFKKFGLKDDQLSFAPHAVDNERFAADKSDVVIKIKQSLSIGSNDIVVLFAGKLEPKKSPELLLDAILSLNLPQVHLVFAGSGILTNTLVTKAGSNNNIHFLKFQNQSAMPAVYQACDIFCLPSKGPGETWGLAVNEAMAAGKCILVSDKCGCAIDMVLNGNGIIFKSEHIGDLLSGLKQLINNKTYIGYGQHSSELIKEWSFLNITKSIEHKLLNGTPVPNQIK